MPVSMPVVATGGMTDDRWGAFYLKIEFFPKRARTLTRVKSVFKGHIARDGGNEHEKQRKTVQNWPDCVCGAQKCDE